jgi:hypothetical protein
MSHWMTSVEGLTEAWKKFVNRADNLSSMHVNGYKIRDVKDSHVVVKIVSLALITEQMT